MAAQGGTEGQRSDEEWLRLVREATGIPELGAGSLTKESRGRRECQNCVFIYTVCIGIFYKLEFST
jgi:hypothetical protein